MMRRFICDAARYSMKCPGIIQYGNTEAVSFKQFYFRRNGTPTSPCFLIIVFVNMQKCILNYLSFVSIGYNNVISISNNSRIGKLGKRVARLF